jgi:hypothetical protein
MPAVQEPRIQNWEILLRLETASTAVSRGEGDHLVRPGVLRGRMEAPIRAFGSRIGRNL